jgi:hypothetical protein
VTHEATIDVIPACPGRIIDPSKSDKPKLFDRSEFRCPISRIIEEDHDYCLSGNILSIPLCVRVRG